MVGFFKVVSQGQKWGYSIDVFGCCFFGEVVGKLVIDDIMYFDIVGLLVILIDVVQFNVVGLFLVGLVFGIDYVFVIQVQ